MNYKTNLKVDFKTETANKAATKMKTETGVIAVAGNPNSGKTTLFNGLTGGRQRIGNWPGVTVEKKEGNALLGGRSVRVVDLPGIYSLSACSEDERIARDYLLSGQADLVINIVDATNFERNLYLTTQLIEMKVPLLIVLTMTDLAQKQGIIIDTDLLSARLDLPVVAVNATSKDGIESVKRAAASALLKTKISSAYIKYPNEIEDLISKWSPALEKVAREVGADRRWIVVNLFGRDEWVAERVLVAIDSAGMQEVEGDLKRVEKILRGSTGTILANYRYGFIHALAEGLIQKSDSGISVSDRIDRVVLSNVFGIPIFLAVIYSVFWFTINLGGAFIDFFDILCNLIFVDGVGLLLAGAGAPTWLIALVANGIGGGIRTVATFIPIIASMFLMLALLEDSGYMARAAFVTDRFLRHIGLPGKAFIPLIVGFGCTVPAIMATRTLENKKDRFLTVFLAPLMSCGARLPVYALFAAAFFDRSAGLIVLSIYLIGILMAILTGLLLKNTLFRGDSSGFIMELPPYHTPRPKHIMIHTWTRLKSFLFRAGKVIVIAVALLSFLNTFGMDGSVGNENSGKSVLAIVGKAITPIFIPMGIERENWPAAVSIITGVFAKEAVVGTLNSLYSQIDAANAKQEGVDTATFDLKAGLAQAFLSIPRGVLGALGLESGAAGGGLAGTGEDVTVAMRDTVDSTRSDITAEAEESVFMTMRKYFSHGPAQAYAYMLFILIYFPCIAALGAIMREVGQGYGWLIVAYLTVTAWITATLFFQIAVGGKIIWIIIPLLLTGGIYAAMSLLERVKE